MAYAHAPSPIFKSPRAPDTATVVVVDVYKILATQTMHLVDS